MTSMRPEPPTSDVPLLAGRYQLLDKLGEGGMGAVFRARDTKLDRPVAVKLLPEGKLRDADAVARFRREALALARLSHPHIIQAHDSGQDGDRHFLVTELVEGRSLAAELAEKGRLAPTRAADYVQQAARALAHAHRLGLIHRDVKPSNLLVDAEGRVKLLDLGLARFLQDQLGDAALTQEGAGMGTPDYCPPEQFRDAHRADARSDVYALGCTLYHLIAGRPPFPGSSLSEKVRAHEERQPTPLEEICPDIPGGLALAAARMMAKRPADRFADMAEVAEALAPYVAGSSASFRDLRNTATWTGSHLATRPAMPWRLRAAWLVAAAVSLLLLAALLALSYGLRRGGRAEMARPNPAGEPEAPDDRKAPPASPEEPAGKAKKEPAGLAAPEAPHVLTVSKDPKDGGRFRTLREAVAAVNQPGMTVRVLDDAEYRESVMLRDRAAQEGLTLEAPRRATIVTPPQAYGVGILQVPRVTLRGFRIRPGTDFAAVGLTGAVPGVVLQDLEVAATAPGLTTGVSVESARVGPGETPLLIRGCTFRDCTNSVVVLGMDVRSRRAMPCNGVAVQGNRVENVHVGVWVAGEVSDVQVVGNRIAGCLGAGVRVSDLKKGSGRLLVANNTIVNVRDCLQFQEPIEAATGVRVCNNLLLAEQAPDISATGSDRQVFAAWRVDHNARPIFADAAAGAESPFPPDHDWTARDLGALPRRSGGDRFPRPGRDSPLARSGAGTDDPSLPSYIGAVPSEGADEWDWGRTWRGRTRAK